MAKKAKHLLVVDDQVGIRKLVCEALAEKGYLVEQAASGLEAIQKIKQQHYRLVILDVKMPGISGLEVLQEIRKIDPHLPVVLMTAYNELDVRDQVSSQAVNFRINKPFDLRELHGLVQSIFNIPLQGEALL